MTEAQTALSRRAVACRGWEWMPGMRTLDAMRVIHDPDRWPDRPCAIREGGWVDTAPPRPLGDDLPDFCDPATLGCLLALVREAHGQSTLSPVSRGPHSWCLADYGTSALEGETEVELLVAALEGAP